MANAHHYRFCFGPWNISEGQDPYGPATRPPQSFNWKLDQLRKLGFDAMMFHDDDAVPDIGVEPESEPIEVGIGDLSCPHLLRKGRRHLGQRQSRDGRGRPDFAQDLIDLG